MGAYDYLKTLSNYADIKIDGTEISYNTIDDFGMVISNAVYVSEPEQESILIDVPGRNGVIDASQAVTGRAIYKSRELTIELTRLHNSMDWDAIVSDIRNKLHGKMVKVIFHNDSGYYWYGRMSVPDFKRTKKQGTITLSIPKCDPYKYCVESSIEPWEWDKFNFETGVIYFLSTTSVSGTKTISFPAGYKAVKPEIIVSDMESDTFTVSYDGVTYDLEEGSNKIPAILINGNTQKSLTFTGTADVQVVYRGGSL